MQKIKDERLILKNLQNIRVAFVVQTIGILFLLGYEMVMKGYEKMITNPLWFVFMTTMTVLILLSVNISVEYDRSKRSAQQVLKTGLLTLLLVSILISVLVGVTPGYDMLSGLIMGLVLFVCGFLVLLYVYLVKKDAEEK
ncbi:hypothetical protein ERX35_002920 [Macrococcus equipercicus]|uniref:Branched-chain amino acid ABC transporter substrate-binding protein n=1 Tax=Macrococcus equipercicus TaxID=69967 RepID=A0ABQ6R9H9_9STAP|nr:hypothetical protein [Macrococcus equipercicus]KAA1039956.1 hypothetical protein ERX35_002920 [Macrococcus equipercicus]